MRTKETKRETLEINEMPNDMIQPSFKSSGNSDENSEALPGSFADICFSSFAGRPHFTQPNPAPG